MNRMKIFVTTLMLGLASLVLLTDCATTPRLPIYADPGLAELNFNTVTLLPIVDQRLDRSQRLDLEKKVGNRVEKSLRKKGHLVIRPGAFSDTLSIPNDEVAEMELHELGILGTSDTEYMLIVFLNDASGKTALGYSFKAEMTAVLMNKQTAAMVWKGKGIGSRGQGGMLGCLMSGATKNEAIGAAITKMMGSFPKAPSKR